MKPHQLKSEGQEAGRGKAGGATRASEVPNLAKEDTHTHTQGRNRGRTGGSESELADLALIGTAAYNGGLLPAQHVLPHHIYIGTTTQHQSVLGQAGVRWLCHPQHLTGKVLRWKGMCGPPEHKATNFSRRQKGQG